MPFEQPNRSVLFLDRLKVVRLRQPRISLRFILSAPESKELTKRWRSGRRFIWRRTCLFQSAILLARKRGLRDE